MEGIVIKVDVQNINLDLSRGIHGVETYVWLTVVDDNGAEHLGTLYIRPY